MSSRSAIKSLPPVEWIPHAIIKKPVSYFEKKLGLKFVADCDNLDYFEGTLPARIGNRTYVLRHYRGFPPDAIGIYLPHDLTDPDEISRIIKRVTERLALPSSAISWQRGMAD